MASHDGGLTAGTTTGTTTGITKGTTADTVSNTASAVVINGLTRGFGERAVLRGIDLEIPAGQFTVLVGRSGSGKSTLLRAIAGIDHEVVGTGRIQAPPRVSMVFQDSRLLPWRRVLANVLLGRPRRGPQGAQAQRRGREALAEVGLAGREDAWPNQLSGGEAQRAALARSLVREPDLLLADEPFGALDALTRIKMHTLLRELWERHRPSVLLVTHDVDEAVLLADRVLVLEEGRFSLDLAIDLPHPRSFRDPRPAEFRERLLAALGVREDIGGDPDRAAAEVAGDDKTASPAGPESGAEPRTAETPELERVSS